MNRFVSLLLVALSLAAVSLAQPAQAQPAQAQQGKWYKGLPYFLNSNTQSSSPGTNVTATIKGNATGDLNITSLPGNTYNTYSTSGSYNGSVGVYYVWGGGSITSAMVLSTTQTLEATGAGTGNESGGSNAGAASGQFSYNTRGWDSKVTPTALDYFAAGSTPPSVNKVVSISGNIQAWYNSSNPGTTQVTADVTFGDPHW